MYAKPIFACSYPGPRQRVTSYGASLPVVAEVVIQINTLNYLEDPMKLISCALILLSCSYATGQAAPAKGSSAAQGKHEATEQKQASAEVAPDAAVITVPGVCDTPASGKDCNTVVTRAQFEGLVFGLSKGKPATVTAEMRARFAAQYADMAVFVQEAEKLGLDKDPDTQLLLRFSRMQLLTQKLLESVKEKAQPSPEEIKKYYEEHSSEFQGTSVQRIMIPLAHAGEKTKPEDLKTLVEEMRKRFVAGEDAGKLEQEIYTKLGFKSQPPQTSLVVRATALPPDQQSVAKLKAGEVSEVFSDNSASVIYKYEGEKPLPLDQVREEIRATLEQQKVKAAGDALKSGHKPELNAIYFNPNAQ